MSVALDVSSNFNNPNMDFNGHLFSHTPGSNPNRVLLILTSWVETLPGTQGSPLTSMDFDGAALTLWNDLTANGVHRQVWYLINPHAAVGVVTILPTPDYDGVVDIIGCAATFSGVAQVAPIGSWTTATGSSNAPSVTVGSTSTDSLIVDVLGIMHGAAYATRTVGPGQTLISNQQVTGTFGGTFRLSNSDSWEPGTGAGVVMSWSLSASKNWGIAGFEVLPVSAAVITVTERLSLEAAGPVTATAGLDPSRSISLDLGPARSDGRLDTRAALGVSLGPEVAVATLVTLTAVGAAVGPGAASAVLGLRGDVGAQLGPGAAATRLDTRADLAVNLISEGVKG